jgi:hypothetical protein
LEREKNEKKKTLSTLIADWKNGGQAGGEKVVPVKERAAHLPTLLG